METSLTDRERQVYDFIRAYVERHGYAPKLREIGTALGIQSRGTVHRYVRSLEQAGLVAVEASQARGLRLPPGDDTPGDTGRHTLPLLGRIAAGQPIEAIPGEDEIDLSEFFIRPNRYVLRVQGDSMIEAGILSGDMVVVESRDTARDGEIVVALIDGVEATLKYLRRNADASITLRPANAALAPMRYAAARVRIQGVVVGQFRSYR